MWDWIKKLFNGTALGRGLHSASTIANNADSVLNGAINSITQEHMTGAAREASDYEQQNAKDMALFNRDLSEDWYNKHQSASALVKEYQDAGLNPALMFGNSASVGGDNMQQMATGASATTGANPISALDMVSMLMDVSMRKEQIRSIKQENDFNEDTSESRKLGIELDNKLKQGNIDFTGLRAYAQQLDNDIVEAFGMTKAQYESETAKWEAFARENSALYEKEIQPFTKRALELANKMSELDLSKKSQETLNLKQQLENLKADYDRIKAQVSNINANTAKTEKETSYIDMNEFGRYISVSAQLMNATTYAEATQYPMYLDSNGNLSKTGKGVMASWQGLEATIQSSINKVWGDSGFYIPSGYHGKMPLNKNTTRPASENVSPDAIVAQYKSTHEHPDMDSFVNFAVSKGMSRISATTTYVMQVLL